MKGGRPWLDWETREKPRRWQTRGCLAMFINSISRRSCCSVIRDMMGLLISFKAYLLLSFFSSTRKTAPKDPAPIWRIYLNISDWTTMFESKGGCVVCNVIGSLLYVGCDFDSDSWDFDFWGFFWVFFACVVFS